MRETTAEPRSDGREATRATPGSLEQLDFRRFRLRVGEGASRAFDRRAILIGSNPDSDLVVDHPTVSRLHARLEYDGRGYRLTDLGSRNGVTVDGVRVETAWLGETARLGLGDAVVWFALDAERVAVEAPLGVAVATEVLVAVDDPLAAAAPEALAVAVAAPEVLGLAPVLRVALGEIASEGEGDTEGVGEGGTHDHATVNAPDVAAALNGATSTEMAPP